MYLRKQCQDVVDRSMRKHFPDWDSISPVDPRKIFVDGILGSLVEIEKMSIQRMERALDRMPAFFGFQPRVPLAPTGYFEWFPSELLTSSIEIPAQTHFQYILENETWDVFTTEKRKIFPYLISSVEKNGAKTQLVFTTQVPLTELELQFLPERLAPVLPEYQFKIERWNASKNQYEEIPGQSYFFSNLTQDWSQYGKLHFRSARQEGILFDATAKYMLSWTFPSETTPAGNFYTHLIPCQCVKITEDNFLGNLQGELWEEISLPEDVCKVPDTLEVQYPNDEVVRLTRVDFSVLESPKQSADHLNHSFIYEPFHHKLVIPAAFHLMKQYEGGVQVKAKKLVRFPFQDWPVDQAKLTFSGFSGMIEKIRPIRLERNRIYREPPTEYWTRFFASFRQFMTQNQNNSLIIWEEIRLKTLGSSPRIQAVEIRAIEELRFFEIFVMERLTTESVQESLSKDLENQVHQLLKKQIPLGYSWKISPFQSFFLKIRLQLEIPAPRTHFFPRETEEAILPVQTALENLFHPGNTERTITTEEIRETILKAIPNEASRTFPGQEEIRNSQILLISTGTGELIQSVTRSIGIRIVFQTGFVIKSFSGERIL